MNVKTVISAILLLVVAISVAAVLLNQTVDKEKQELTTTAENNSIVDKKETDEKTIVYYFHGNTRCATCKAIEAFTIKAVNARFADLVEAGTIEFQAINLDDPANEHFVKDYDLATRCVVVSKTAACEEVDWKRLDDVWTKVKNEAEFNEYITSNITAIIKGNVDA